MRRSFAVGDTVEVRLRGAWMRAIVLGKHGIGGRLEYELEIPPRGLFVNLRARASDVRLYRPAKETA